MKLPRRQFLPLAAGAAALPAAVRQSLIDVRLAPQQAAQKKRTFPNRRFDSGRFDTPGDRVVAARVPSLFPKPGWCMLRKNFGRGASWALKPAWPGCALQCSLQR